MLQKCVICYHCKIYPLNKVYLKQKLLIFYVSTKKIYKWVMCYIYAECNTIISILPLVYFPRYNSWPYLLNLDSPLRLCVGCQYMKIPNKLPLFGDTLETRALHDCYNDPSLQKLSVEKQKNIIIILPYSRFSFFRWLMANPLKPLIGRYHSPKNAAKPGNNWDRNFVCSMHGERQITDRTQPCLTRYEIIVYRAFKSSQA